MEHNDAAIERIPYNTAKLFCWYYQGELHYPMPVARLFIRQQQVSSPSEGLHLIAELLQNCSEWFSDSGTSTILAFSIEQETGVDDWERRCIWMYDAKGEYLGEDAGPRPFQGRPPETLRFQHGDRVTYLARGAHYELRQGTVLGVPLSPERVAEISAEPCAATPDDSDDTYAIYSREAGDYSHEHLAECYVLERFSCIRDDNILGSDNLVLTTDIARTTQFR